jgi:cyclin-dependent kinase 7
MFEHKDNIFMVLELQHTDLECIVKAKHIPLPMADIRHYMRHLCLGVAYLHANWVLHRDLKPSNLLVGTDARLTIADFGLARQFGGHAAGAVPFTSQVVTRWYRAPELLFGARHYGWAVDAWACGCVLAEMLLRGPLFPGDSDVDQLAKIAAVVGTIDNSNWPGVERLPDYVALVGRAPLPLISIFQAADAVTLDLLAKLLAVDPRNRIALGEATASHAYFVKCTAAERADAQAAAALRVQQLPSAHSRGAQSKSGASKRDGGARDSDDDDDGADNGDRKRIAADESDEGGAEQVRKRLAL